MKIQYDNRITLYAAGRRDRQPSACSKSFRLLTYESTKDSIFGEKADIETFVITEIFVITKTFVITQRAL